MHSCIPMAFKEDSLCFDDHRSLFGPGHCVSFEAEDSFQRKKDVEAHTKTPVPPKTPVKFSPWFRFGREASLVTYKEDRFQTVPLSPLYNKLCKDRNYMEQVFKDVTQVGEGHFGKVFRVVSREDNKVYAVKVSKEIFHNEAERLKRSEEVRKHEMIPIHPNCVRLFNAWEEQGKLYLWLEFCDTSLEAYAEKNHDINEIKVWEILLDLLLGLKNLHDNRLVHVDVKLENILMTSDGTCKLADFGLLVDMSTDPSPPKNVVEGDGRYLAPELLEGGPCTPAVDVFSLGLCILELAADIVMPVGGDDWQSLRRGEIPIQKTKHLSEELKSVIVKMLTPNHLERPTVDTLLTQPRLKQMWAERRILNPSLSSCSTASMTEVIRRKCGRPERGVLSRRSLTSPLFGSKPPLRRRLGNGSIPSQQLPNARSMQFSDDELEAVGILNNDVQLDILASSTPFKPPTPTRRSCLVTSQRTLNFGAESASSSSPSSSPPISPRSSFFPKMRSGSPLNSVGENPPASPVSMDESPRASPDFSLLHHSNSGKDSVLNTSAPLNVPQCKSLNRSLNATGRMGRNLLHSFNSSEDDSDHESSKNLKEKKRRDKKRR